jgi:hypothetical protein
MTELSNRPEEDTNTPWQNFPATAFFNGTPPEPIVNWFEGSANFGYFGEDVAAYKGYDSTNPLSPNVKDLIPALKSLSAINGSQAGADSFAGFFDIHQIFAAMAFEYLAENWDAYWANSRNYALYFDVSSGFPLTSSSLVLNQLEAHHSEVVLHPSRFRLHFRAIQPRVSILCFRDAQLFPEWLIGSSLHVEVTPQLQRIRFGNKDAPDQPSQEQPR